MNRSSRALNFFSLLALLAIVLGLTGCYSDSSAADDLWTKNIHAVADAIYNVGSSTARYLNGWFVNLHADNVTSNNVTTGELWVSGNTSIHTSDNTALSFQGPVGPAGPPGPAGTNGHTILSGTGAPGSGLGSDGDYYLDTSTEDLYGPKSGTWGSPTSLIGAAGANGLTLLNGSGAPSPATGVDGDFYIDTTAHTLYGPKSGTWGSATSLVGPAGAKGDSGAAGQGYNDRGAWVSGLSYAPYDTTTNAGSTYECTSGIINSTTAPGSDSTHFQVWAAKGDSGATGDPGSTGPAGPDSVSTSTTSSLTANKIVITDETGHLASDNNTYLTTDDDSGLVPYTGATGDVSIGSHGLTTGAVTDSGLTSGRIPVAGTGGLLGDGPAYNTTTSTLTATLNGTSTGVASGGTLTSPVFSGTVGSSVGLASGYSLDLVNNLTNNNSCSGSTSTWTNAAASTITQWQVCYINSASTTPTLGLAEADSSTTMPGLWIATASVSSSATGTFLDVMRPGFIRDDSWTWTVNGMIFVSDSTAGALTQTLPSGTGHQLQVIGIAITAHIIELAPIVVWGLG